MGEVTEIAWTDSTHNAWIGCTKISPGCKFCYAEKGNHRWGHDNWGPGKPRQVLTDAYWRKPLGWNKRAALAKRRHLVFCSSQADVMDDEAPEGQRERLWELIRQTPNLTWLLLTKRPENWRNYLPLAWLTSPQPNVWLGCTVESQECAEKRIPAHLGVPAWVHFLSVEPQIERVTLAKHLPPRVSVFARLARPSPQFTARDWQGLRALAFAARRQVSFHTLDWVIQGGESGQQARPFYLDWAEALAAECREAMVPHFFKQLGAKPCEEDGKRIAVVHPKGGDPREWPLSLRDQQFPTHREILP